jgi:4-amino-4-deoxy-L-arabinose transferase-like glycosyltransferase
MLRAPLLLPGAVVLLAAGVRLLWIALVEPEVDLFDDAGFYHFFGQSIADGRGYVRPEGTPTAFWPIGYPAALAALYGVFGPSLLAAKLLNVALGGGTTLLLYVLARCWFSRPHAALAATIYALWPGAIVYASVTMSETLFTFLFVASLVALAYAPSLVPQRRATNAVFSVLVAAANYVRVQTLALSLLALPWLLYKGSPLRRALVFSASSLAIVAVLLVPWVVRNTLAFDELTFLATNSGTNFYQGHRNGANGGPDFHAQLAFAQRYDYLPPVKREPAWNREGFKEGADFILTHPEKEPWLSVLKVYQLYRADADGLLWNEQNGATPIFSTDTRDRLRLLMDGYFYVAGVVALGGLAYGLWRRADWAVFSALIVVYWTVVHVIFYGEPRLHVGLQPLIALLASVPIATLASVVGTKLQLRPRSDSMSSPTPSR